ncbi:hypothetical protein ACQKQC_17380 [Vibrio fortis]|uniref:hypothetical protein n=1 Tax=Vibrio fortis TaxID=212667 RepID=UPI004068EE76
MEGTKHDDLIVGTDQDDAVNSRAGNDEISTLAGDDFVTAGEGSDKISTGSGNDTVLGDVEYGLEENNDTPVSGEDSWGESYTAYEFDAETNAQQSSHTVRLDNFAVNQAVNTSTTVGGLAANSTVTVQLTDENGTIIASQIATVDANGNITVDTEIPESSIGDNG